MPIDKERAKEIYNMVAENRKIKKLLGDTAYADYFDRVDEYIYSKNARAKNIDPDPATQNMRNMLNKFQRAFRDIEVASKNEFKNGLTEYETMQMTNSLNQMFSNEPGPEEIIADYLRVHGDKHLASEEIQFISALTGAMHGVTDVLDHEVTRQGLDVRKEFFKEIDEDLTAAAESQKKGENAAIKFEMDYSDESLAALKVQVEAESEKLKQDETELKAAFETAQANLKNLPEKDRYLALKLEVYHAGCAKDAHKEKLNGLEKVQTAVKEYESEGIDKLISTHDSLSKQHKEAETEYKAKAKDIDAREKAVKDRLAELGKEEDIIKSHGESIVQRFSDLERTQADLLEMTNAIERIKEQLSNPEKLAALRNAFENYGEEYIREQMEGKAAKEILASNSEAQKYLLAKDSLLQAFPESEEEEKEAGAVQTTKDKFETMELCKFEDKYIEQIRKEILDGSAAEKQKAMQQELAELKKYTDIHIEIDNLRTEKTNLFFERSAAKRDLRHASEKLDDFNKKHEYMCKKIFSKLGIKDKKVRQEYSGVDKWKDLTERLNKETEEEKTAYEKAEERVKNGEAALEKESKIFEEVKNKIEKNTADEIELGAKLQNVAAKKVKVDEQKQAYNDVAGAKQAIKNGLKVTLKTEEGLCKHTAETYNGHFAAEKISAQLAKLDGALSVSKKLGKNSEEYTQLKNALQEARNVFSGAEENWRNKTPAQRRARQNEVLEHLGQKASHYLGEKEKQPHIWPFASTSGFKRRAAAEDILSYSKNAADIVNKTADIEFDISDRIASCKDAEGNWKVNRTEELIAEKQTEFSKNIENGIKIKNIGSQAAENSVNNEAPVTKKEGKALGGF